MPKFILSVLVVLKIAHFDSRAALNADVLIMVSASAGVRLVLLRDFDSPANF